MSRNKKISAGTAHQTTQQQLVL